MTTESVQAKTVMGVNLAKIDRAVLRQSVKHVLKKDPANAPDEAMVTDLASYFQKHNKQLMECLDCDGGSPVDFGSCPYCGSEDEDASASPEPKPKAEVVTTLVVKNGVRTMQKPGTVLDVAIDSIHKTEKDLNDAVARIQAIKAEGSLVLYKLGYEILGIYKQDLWKQRGAGEGKPRYKSFTQFLAAEVDIHQRTAWKMMAVAKEYTPAQVQKHGNTILRGLLAAPKEDREELLEKMGKGEIEGSRGLDREVRKIRERKGVKVLKGLGNNPKKNTRAASEASAAKKKKIVTTTFPVGRVSVDLLAKKAKKSDPEKPAKKLADHPHGKFECSNGVTFYYAIIEHSDGTLKLQVEARRED